MSKMLSPAGCYKYHTHFLRNSSHFVTTVARLFQSRGYSVVKMTTKTEWSSAKDRILQLPLDEKRKLYTIRSYLTLNQVDSWYKYLTENKSILEEKRPTEEDNIEFRKIKIDPEKNKVLAERVSIFQGDITKLEIDAIVNASNSRLRAGGGVDGAIHKAAGPLLQDECFSLGGCSTGEAKVTGGYNLPAKYVIQTVGPQNGSAPNLQACYENSLAHHQQYQLRSIAFPCISTGIYSFPNRLAAHIALRTARKFLEQNNEMERIIFCTFLPVDDDIYQTLMQMYFPIN